MIKWFIHNIDYFSSPVQITFNNRKNYSTFLGKIISIIIYSITIALIITSWKSLFNRLNPKTSTTNTYRKSSPLMNLTELKSIYIAAFQTRDFLPFNDPSYLTIETNLFEVRRYENGSSSFNYIPLNQKNCSDFKQIFIEKGFQKDYEGNYLDQAICIDLKSQDIVLGGNFASNYFSNFNYNFKKCVNSSESNVICKTQEEIDDKIKGSFLQFFYFDNFVDLNNYSEIYEEKFIHYYIVLDPKSTKFVDIFFKYVNVSSDIGLIFEDKKYLSAVSYDYNKEQIDTSATDNLVIKFYVNSSNNSVYYTRVYTKFQEFAATIGGLLKIMTFFGSLITSTFTQYEMHEKMFNSIFDFSTKNNPIKKNNQFKKDISQKSNASNIPIINNLISNKDFLTEFGPNQNTEMNVKNKENFNKNIIIMLNSNTKNKIKLGIYDVLKMTVCFCKKKEQLKWRLVKLATQKITKYLDYLKISKILVDFNRVKKILFNKAQRSILKLSSKPKISVEDMNDSQGESKVEKSEEEKYLSLLNYYSLLRENKNDPINEKLLNILDQRYKNIFEDILNEKNHDGKEIK
jgi:hypothetical protein